VEFKRWPLKTDTKAQVDEIYKAHPALLVQKSRVLAAGSNQLAHGPSGVAQVSSSASWLVEEAKIYLKYLGGEPKGALN